ncbi:MAG: ABC transporter ATP-binding protein [Halarsenatibacteraceae bacterium]
MQAYNFKSFFLRYKKRYLLGIIWLALVDILQLIIPQILRDFTDNLQAGLVGSGELIRYAGLIVLVAGGTAFFRFLWRLYINGTARRLERNLRNDLYQHFQRLSANYFQQQKTGDLMAHATNDINAIRRATGPGVVMLADAILLTIATISILIFSIDIRLTLIALIPLPFITLISLKFGQIIHKKFKKVQEAFSDLSDKAQENFSGIRVVKAFAREEKEIERFQVSNENNYERNVDLVKSWGLFRPLVQFFSGMSFLIVIWLGGRMVIEEAISLGDFVAFISYLGMLTWPMMALGFVINHIQRGRASLERLNNILDEEPDVYNYPDTNYTIDELQGEIEFNNLTFSYPDEDETVLKEISFKIESGQTVAFIGRTGSGKSTIARLILRLFNSERESLYLDGHDINKVPLETIRENTAFVPQDNFLFSTTIGKNIAFHNPETDIELIEQAAREAAVYDNINDFPEGFDTILGERGVTLSGGQQQRVALARALIKRPDILILDDSLSAVDTRTEETILNNLEEIMAERTTILIALRISTIKNADKIFVLDDGSIIEEGDHESLLDNQGLYYDLYQKQLLEEKLENQ